MKLTDGQLLYIDVMEQVVYDFKKASLKKPAAGRTFHVRKPEELI